MPGLTVDTSSRSQEGAKQPLPSSSPTERTTNSHSRSSSPTRPPYSPITPTLASARLTTAQPPPNSSSPPPSSSSRPPQTYTHTTQTPQTSIPQPSPTPIDFTSNPDALALKSAISILQIQARRAREDITTLQGIKERASADPEGFVEALGTGGLSSTSDPLFHPPPDDEDEDDGEDEEAGVVGEKMDSDGQNGTTPETKTKKWPTLPTPQNVVRFPPINWTQYAVVGESLDKLHADQLARPVEGMPQRVGLDGSLLYGGDGVRRVADVGVAAPYAVGRDKIEKGGKKGKK